MCITGDIVEFTTLAQSTVSQHLKVLRDAGLIQGEIEGPATCYCISAEGIQFLKSQVEKWLPNCCDIEPGTGQVKLLLSVHVRTPSSFCDPAAFFLSCYIVKIAIKLT